MVDVTQELIDQMSFLVKFFQALGGLIILYVIFNITNMILNRKKKRQLQKINENLDEIKKLLSKGTRK
ncbi:MAG: hypothetical protein KKF68_02500 [Nanoarchaeota archaeon]|nr:hypothetical protein [Nanoarchaeota archaeon]